MNSDKNQVELNQAKIPKVFEEAMALYYGGNFEGAKVIYVKLLQEDPNNCDALHLLGLADFSLKNYQNALISITKAISINPYHASFHSNLGNVFRKLGQNSKALESYDRAIRLDPNNATAYGNRGVVLQQEKRYSEALVSFNNSIKLDPSKPEVFNNFGNTLRDLGKFKEALALYDYGIKLNPNLPEIFLDRGNVLSELGLFSESVESYERAIYLRADFAEAHMNKAHVLLVNGHFDEGFESFEWRWHTALFSGLPRSFSAPLWLGDPQSLSGKTILLYAEQGIGDVIQFCRYVKSVSDLGAHVILEVPNKLVNLLKSLDGNYQLVSVESISSHFDYRCPLMSLPLALKTTLYNIPLSKGYLQADQTRVSKIQEELRLKNPESKKLCGISWLSKADKTGLFRSIHLKDFISMLDKDDFLCVNLQYGEVDQEISQLAKDLGVTVVNLESVNKYDDIDGLAATIQACDLVISIDNTTVHLAGALGTDARVLLPYVPDWRWLLDRKDSPWYQSLRLYRQQALFDWGSAFVKLKEDL